MKIKLLDKRLSSVEYATPGSCAIDLRACIDEPLALRSGDVDMIKTGIALDMSDGILGMGAIILPRSGLGTKHGIVLANLVGLIDNDYQGEIIVALWHRAQQTWPPYVIEPLDRIAQLAFVPFLKPMFEYVNEFDGETSRGAGGFGSTGVV